MDNNYNLGAIDLSSNDNTSADKFFNNYYSPTFRVSPNVDAAIISYFETVAENKSAAKVLASAVIYTSRIRGIDPMVTLKEFMALPQGDLNAYLAMFLNLQRVGTSFLGLSSQPVANKYVARSILA